MDHWYRSSVRHTASRGNASLNNTVRAENESSDRSSIRVPDLNRKSGINLKLILRFLDTIRVRGGQQQDLVTWSAKDQSKTVQYISPKDTQSCRNCQLPIISINAKTRLLRHILYYRAVVFGMRRFRPGPSCGGCLSKERLLPRDHHEFAPRLR